MLVLSSSLDREVQAHKHFTGATNIYWLNELMRYVRSEGLLNSFRLYPMVARTNYGTGVTVRGLGRLTGNQMTLVNGPTWGASGIAFASASSQYGTIADFLGSETLTVFLRADITQNTTSVSSYLGQYNFGTANDRSFRFSQNGGDVGDPIIITRSSSGQSNPETLEQYTSDTSGIGSENTFVAQWVDGGGRSLWVNKSSKILTLSLGTAQTTRYNSSSNIQLFSDLNNGTPTNFTTGTAKATAFLTGSVTTAQRETITDLINEL